jgi:hypothetical protein
LLLTEFAVEGFDRLTEAMGPLKMKDADDELQAAGRVHTICHALAGTFPSHVAQRVAG